MTGYAKVDPAPETAVVPITSCALAGRSDTVAIANAIANVAKGFIGDFKGDFIRFPNAVLHLAKPT